MLTFRLLRPPRDGVRRVGHRRARGRHRAAAARGPRVLWHWQPWKLVARGGGLRRRRGDLPRGQPVQGRPRRVAAPARSRGRVHRHDHLAARTGHRVRATGGRRRARCTTSSRTSAQSGVRRVPGIAVFPHPGKDTTPLALRANVEHNHVLHEHVIIVSASTANVPHVPAAEAFTLDDLGLRRRRHPAPVGALRVLRRARHPRRRCGRRAPQGVLGPRGADVDDASYFLSRGSLRRTSAPGTGPLAQDAVPRPRAQRRRPGRLLRPARRPHRHHGQRREVLAPHRDGPHRGQVPSAIVALV